MTVRQTIDQMIADYNNSAEEHFQELSDEAGGNEQIAKSAALSELKSKLPQLVLDYEI